MTEQLISARVKLNNYSNKILGIIKLKFDLHDKSEAVNKFVEIFGETILEEEVSDDYLAKVISLTKKHLEKYKNKKMSLAELDKLCEI